MTERRHAKTGREDTGEEDRGGFGAGFVASAIVVSAVLLCGILLVVTSVGDSPASLPRATDSPAPAPSSVRTPQARTGCRLPDGDQAVPRSAPSATEWVVYRRTVVPRHDAIGPARTDPDGFRHCFAHSATGAVYATYNAIAALADDVQVLPTARKLLLPGPDRDRLLRELAAETSEPEDTSSAELAGFRVIDASRDRLTVAIAMRDGDSLSSGTFTMVWQDGDWRVLPPREGEEFGAPYAELDGLSGFIVWGGV